MKNGQYVLDTSDVAVTAVTLNVQLNGKKRTTNVQHAAITAEVECSKIKKKKNREKDVNV